MSADPRLLEGLAWGRPRKGHPEGAVGNHVADLLATIDAWGETGGRARTCASSRSCTTRFKYAVSALRPKTGENHHAMRARRFAEGYTDDERLLATIELHDRPYHLWRRKRRTGQRDGSQGGRDARPASRTCALFLRFVELDGSTEGKRPEPVEWLRGGAPPPRPEPTAG